MIFIEYPKCSTCKRVKNHLINHGYSFTVRDIKIDHPTKDELLLWCKPDTIHKFFNTSGNLYKELGLKDKLKEMDYLEKIELLATNGMLVKRPILLDSDKVYVGPKEIEEKF
jgi:arsenate reductase